jgi:hypothetical protein
MFALPPLYPETFFSASVKGYKATKLGSAWSKRKFLLPDVSLFLSEEKFADVYFFWNEQGIGLYCEVQTGFADCFYPKYQEGDCLEIFIDTRDLKNANVTHRFCHHFVFLPVEVQGVRAMEITHFRSEDKHPLADPNLLVVDAEIGKKKYTLSAFIMKEALFGYDPMAFSKLGFAYRIRRMQAPAQHFPATFIERHPSLWSTITLED